MVRNSETTPTIFPTVPRKVANAQNVSQKNYDKQFTNKYIKDNEDRNRTVFQVLEENPHAGVRAIEEQINIPLMLPVIIYPIHGIVQSRPYKPIGIFKTCKMNKNFRIY